LNPEIQSRWSSPLIADFLPKPEPPLVPVGPFLTIERPDVDENCAAVLNPEE
jgi:hypothetical protein